MNESNIRILLADDHPVVRDGYKRLLESQGNMVVVAEAGNADQAYQAYVQFLPDVAVLDLSMPGGGLDALRRILARDERANTLVFSMHDSELMIRRALNSGAKGYLIKHSPTDLLIDAIRVVAEGKSYVDPSRCEDLKNSEGKGGSPAEALSTREFQIFHLIAEGQSLAEIASALYISPKTAHVHHANIMRKLGLKNDAQLVRLAFEHQIIR